MQDGGQVLVAECELGQEGDCESALGSRQPGSSPSSCSPMLLDLNQARAQRAIFGLVSEELHSPTARVPGQSGPQHRTSPLPSTSSEAPGRNSPPPLVQPDRTGASTDSLDSTPGRVSSDLGPGSTGSAPLELEGAVFWPVLAPESLASTSWKLRAA